MSCRVLVHGTISDSTSGGWAKCAKGLQCGIGEKLYDVRVPVAGRTHKQNPWRDMRISEMCDSERSPPQTQPRFRFGVVPLEWPIPFPHGASPCLIFCSSNYSKCDYVVYPCNSKCAGLATSCVNSLTAPSIRCTCDVRCASLAMNPCTFAHFYPRASCREDNIMIIVFGLETLVSS